MLLLLLHLVHLLARLRLVVGLAATSFLLLVGLPAAPVVSSSVLTAILLPVVVLMVLVVLLAFPYTLLGGLLVVSGTGLWLVAHLHGAALIVGGGSLILVLLILSLVLPSLPLVLVAVRRWLLILRFLLLATG